MELTHRFRMPLVKLVAPRSLLNLALLVLVGCGGKPAAVSGLVTVDGKILDQGSVTFSPTGGGMRASGIIQSDGSFQIQTNREAGLDVGEYDVAVVSREIISTGPNSPPRPGKYLAPKIYGKTRTSGLHFKVEQGSNEIDLALSSKVGSSAGKSKSKR